MKVPLSWLKEYVDVDLSIVDLARTLTMLGLEVDEVRVVGLPMPYEEAAGGSRAGGDTHEFKVSGLAWDPEKFVVASISEVMPHPNADRLTLCRLDDGQQEHVVLTGAPNLYPYKGQGVLAQPLKVAYAKEGARLYDGHQPGQTLTTLKRAKIRGVESYSMVCSEKELGISEEHEGVILLDPDAPTGMPLAEYMGDAVYELSILPNMIRNASILGVAREVAAATGKTLRQPSTELNANGAPIEGKAFIEIREPELNPRFVAGLIQGVEIGPSPYWVQRRLRLAGMRPISNIVDATNYVMLEIGEPLHAFDYDRLVERAGGKAPTIITRTAQPGERLTTLDGVERKLDPYTVLVTDSAGALSIAGVMGGAETEVSDQTRNILLEGASWNFINIRKTVNAQKLNSEAAYRFSRGVHPALAETGVKVGLRRMQAWSGGEIARGLVDAYPLPAVDPLVTVSSRDMQRLLGITLTADEIAALLERVEFTCQVEGSGDAAVVHAQVPPHRMDIGVGVIGVADIAEEVGRLYGYDRIPFTRLDETLPPQHANPSLEDEETTRDVLVSLGLQEVVTHRITSPEREARLYPAGANPDQAAYLRLQNPITPERAVMRHSVLAAVMEVMERNARLNDRLAMFEIGPAFLPRPDQTLPDEPRHLAIALRGLRQPHAWDEKSTQVMDFFDLKGVIEALLDGLHCAAARYEPAEHPTFHPGKCARVLVGDTPVGVFGELNPRVQAQYDFGANPVQAADIDLEALLASVPRIYDVRPVPAFPPVLEDIAVVVDEALPAAQVEALIRQTGGKLLAAVRLFDIFRGPQLGEGKKSLAYSLTYQALDRTLTDSEAAQIRQRIIRRLEQELGAKLRA